MAKMQDGLRALAKANLVPEDEYQFIVAKVRVGMGANNWERADCAFIDPPDPSLNARRISHMLGSPDTGDWRGLMEILFAAQLEEVPDGDYGEGDTRNLEGVKFTGRIFHGTGRRGPEAKISPNIDDDWVKEFMDRDDDDLEEEEEAPKRRSKKKVTKTTKRGRR